MRFAPALLAFCLATGCATRPVATFDGAWYRWWRDHDGKLLHDRYALLTEGLGCLGDICDAAWFCSPDSPFACVSSSVINFAAPRAIDELAWEFNGRSFCLQRTGRYAIPGGWIAGSESSLINVDVGGQSVGAAIIHELDSEGDVQRSFFYSTDRGMIQYLDWADYPEAAAVTVSLAGECGVGCRDLESRYAPDAILAKEQEPQVIRTASRACAVDVIVEESSSF